jgi:hypothetical protein
MDRLDGILAGTTSHGTARSTLNTFFEGFRRNHEHVRAGTKYLYRTLHHCAHSRDYQTWKRESSRPSNRGKAFSPIKFHLYLAVYNYFFDTQGTYFPQTFSVNQMQNIRIWTQAAHALSLAETEAKALAVRPIATAPASRVYPGERPTQVGERGLVDIGSIPFISGGKSNEVMITGTDYARLRGFVFSNDDDDNTMDTNVRGVLHRFFVNRQTLRIEPDKLYEILYHAAHFKSYMVFETLHAAFILYRTEFVRQVLSENQVHNINIWHAAAESYERANGSAEDDDEDD